MSPELGDGSAFTVFMFFFFFQDAECFAGGIGAVNIFGVENIAELITPETNGTSSLIVTPFTGIRTENLESIIFFVGFVARCIDVPSAD